MNLPGERMTFFLSTPEERHPIWTEAQGHAEEPVVEEPAQYAVRVVAEVVPNVTKIGTTRRVRQT